MVVTFLNNQSDCKCYQPDTKCFLMSFDDRLCSNFFFLILTLSLHFTLSARCSLSWIKKTRMYYLTLQRDIFFFLSRVSCPRELTVIKLTGGPNSVGVGWTLNL